VIKLSAATSPEPSRLESSRFSDFTIRPQPQRRFRPNNRLLSLQDSAGFALSCDSPRPVAIASGSVQGDLSSDSLLSSSIGEACTGSAAWFRTAHHCSAHPFPFPRRCKQAADSVGDEMDSLVVASKPGSGQQTATSGAPGGSTGATGTLNRAAVRAGSAADEDIQSAERSSSSSSSSSATSKPAGGFDLASLIRRCPLDADGLMTKLQIAAFTKEKSSIGIRYGELTRAQRNRELFTSPFFSRITRTTSFR
jgi:hypothetical protein